MYGRNNKLEKEPSGGVKTPKINEKVFHPFVVVGLLKTVVVVDGKRVWDSRVLKNRRREISEKTCWLQKCSHRDEREPRPLQTDPGLNAKTPTARICQQKQNNDIEEKVDSGVKVWGANVLSESASGVSCLRETLTLRPIPRVSLCVCPVLANGSIISLRLEGHSTAWSPKP